MIIKCFNQLFVNHGLVIWVHDMTLIIDYFLQWTIRFHTRHLFTLYLHPDMNRFYSPYTHLSHPFFGKMICVTSPLPMSPASLYALTSVMTFVPSYPISVAVNVTVEPNGEGLTCFNVTAPPIPSSCSSRKGRMIFRDTHSM